MLTLSRRHAYPRTRQLELYIKVEARRAADQKLLHCSVVYVYSTCFSPAVCANTDIWTPVADGWRRQVCVCAHIYRIYMQLVSYLCGTAKKTPAN